MKLIDCEQRGGQWFDARLGKPTASHFCEIFTPAGKLRTGAAPRTYALELVGERLTGYPTQHYDTKEMQRGVELEPRARAWYEFATGNKVKEVGFALADCGRWGCSPDGLMDDRGLEIKCPMQPNFMKLADSLAVPDDHVLQVQASLWITGLPAWDYVCWTDCRGLVPQIIEVRPDAKLHAAFAEHLPAWCDALDEMETKLRAAGHGVIAKQEEPEDDDEFNPFK